MAAMLVVAAGGAGMATAAPDPGSGLRTVAPVRVLDTRSGLGAPKAPIQANSTLNIATGDLADTVTAIVVNITVVNGTASSYLTVRAGGGPRPNTSTVNWTGTSAVANGATISVHAGDDLSIFNAAGTVDVVIDLIGFYTPGAPGRTGPMGPAGPAGEIGPAGPAGADGAVGETGPAGVVGPIGPIGATGPPGPAGTPGLIGPAGPIGDTGPAGLPGPIGATGAVGAVGPAGPAGDIGPAGLPGPVGAPGLPGPAGADGADGATGPTGDTGPAGPAGPAGADGAVGPAGEDGTSAGPAGSVYLQAFNTTAETIHRSTTGDVLTFGAVGTSSGGITFAPGGGTFTVVTTGTYKVTFSITAVQANQFNIRVNGSAPGASPMLFGAAAGAPNVGTAILTLAAGDVITLENLTSTGAVPPPALDALGAPALLAGDVTLAVNTGGTAAAVNASIVIEQLNDAPED